MSVKEINRWFKDATRADVNELLEKIILTPRQTRVFEMFYLRGQDINFIADTLCISASVINEELKVIRCKISAVFR